MGVHCSVHRTAGCGLQGSWFFKGSFFAPSLFQVPLLTLSVAMLVGSAEVLRSLGDSMDEDARRDSTQDIDWLFNIAEEPAGSMRNGRFVVTNDLGGTAQAAEAELRSLQLIPQGMSKVAEAPTSITLDWQTAAAKVRHTALPYDCAFRQWEPADRMRWGLSVDPGLPCRCSGGVCCRGQNGRWRSGSTPPP